MSETPEHDLPTTNAPDLAPDGDADAGLSPTPAEPDEDGTDVDDEG